VREGHVAQMTHNDCSGKTLSRLNYINNFIYQQLFATFISHFCCNLLSRLSTLHQFHSPLFYCPSCHSTINEYVIVRTC